MHTFSIRKSENCPQISLHIYLFLQLGEAGTSKGNVVYSRKKYHFLWFSTLGLNFPQALNFCYVKIFTFR